MFAWSLALLLCAGVHPGTVAAQVRSEGPPLVRPGDVLQIRFWPDQQLSGEFRVQSSGQVTVPFAGELEVGGKLLDWAAAEIGRRYAETTSNGTISVTLLFRVSVLGAVQRPGLYQADPSLTVLDVIGQAGGFAPNADLAEVRLLRDGRAQVIDANGLREGRLDQLGLLIRSGDQVIVPDMRRSRFSFQSIVTAVQTVAVLITLFIQLR